MKIISNATVAALLALPTLLQASPLVYQGSETLREVFENSVVAAGLEGEFDYAGGGSSLGEKALVTGQQGLAPMSRSMKDAQREEAIANGYAVEEIIVALDAVNIYSKMTNSLEMLSIDDLAAIFTCEKTMWSDFGGPLSEIKVFVRDTASGTTETFMKLVGIEAFGDCAQMVETGEDIGRETSSDGNAIGYSGADGRTADNKAFDIAEQSGTMGYAPSLDNIRSFDYPLRNLYVYWLSEGYGADDAESKLFQFFGDRSHTDPIVEAAGFVTID
jgi:ABC-type phosphate transport system substrate-binding protein